MLIKFFARGRGKGSGPVDYLLVEKGVNGLHRTPPPLILSGNPELTSDLIDSLDWKHKYNSGVLSFAPEDAPTETEQQQLIDSFEAYAFAGLPKDSFNILWVRHTHTSGGRVELHFVTPRLELYTGKSLNIAPPGWHGYFKPWQTYWNIKQQWARPDDPNRKRILQKGFRELKSANSPEEQTPSDPRQLITDYLIERIQFGLINNREGIIAELKQLGFDLPRIGQNYLTVRDRETNQRFRLKGAIYETSWGIESGNSETLTREVSSTPIRKKSDNSRIESKAHPDRDRIRPTLDDLESLQERILSLARRRAEYNQKRYPYAEPAIAEILAQPLPPAHLDLNYEQYMYRQLDSDLIYVPSVNLPETRIKPTQPGNPEPKEHLRADEKIRARNTTNREGDIYLNPTVETNQRRMDLSEPTLLPNQINEVEHDRNTNSLINSYNQINRANRTLNQAISDTDERIIHSKHQFEESINFISEINQRLKSTSTELESTSTKLQSTNNQILDSTAHLETTNRIRERIRERQKQLKEKRKLQREKKSQLSPKPKPKQRRSKSQQLEL